MCAVLVGKNTHVMPESFIFVLFYILLGLRLDHLFFLFLFYFSWPITWYKHSLKKLFFLIYILIILVLQSVINKFYICWVWCFKPHGWCLVKSLHSINILSMTSHQIHIFFSVLIVWLNPFLEKRDKKYYFKNKL